MKTDQSRLPAAGMFLGLLLLGPILAGCGDSSMTSSPSGTETSPTAPPHSDFIGSARKPGEPCPGSVKYPDEAALAAVVKGAVRVPEVDGEAPTGFFLCGIEPDIVYGSINVRYQYEVPPDPEAWVSGIVKEWGRGEATTVNGYPAFSDETVDVDGKKLSELFVLTDDTFIDIGGHGGESVDALAAVAKSILDTKPSQ